ncbi:MAG: tetratricopeptide repeat protein [Deltaproteobacteria bacterium]|nr:tetratricopeptide repeat protein [Deltaproteobacteria bacterium]
MKTSFRVFTLLIVALISAGAVAGKADKQKAQKAFKQGVKLFEAGNMEEAVQKFRHADALNPSWKIKYNIGQCEASLKRYGLAIEAFEQYLGQGGDDITLKRRDEVLAELDRLRRMVGTITISGEPGVDVYVDVVKRANTSVRTSIKVTAGVEHEISFVKDGEKMGSVKLIISGGEVVSVPTDAKRPSTVAVSQTGSTDSSNAKPAKPKASVKYTTMRQLKTDLRSGVITRAEYKTHQRKIRELRAAEFDQLKRDLRAKKISRRQYKIRTREVKNKYEGN